MNEPAGAPVPSPAPVPALWDIAWTFNRVALMSFGGGLSAWTHELVVRRRAWLTEEEFLSAATLCRLLPGANQVNVAIFVGTRLRGWPGAVAAVGGLTALPFCILVALIASVRNVESDALRHVMAGLIAGAIGLTLSMVWRTGRAALDSAVPAILAVATVAMSAVFRLPLWATLVLLGPVGIWWAWRRPEAGK